MEEKEKAKQISPYTQAPPGPQAPPGFQAPPGSQAPPGLQGYSEQRVVAKKIATPELMNKLRNKDSSVRRNAADAIGVIGDMGAVDSLITVLKDDNRFVRQEVARALGKIGGAKALEALTQALVVEKDEFVKDTIKKAIERLQTK